MKNQHMSDSDRQNETSHRYASAVGEDTHGSHYPKNEHNYGTLEV